MKQRLTLITAALMGSVAFSAPTYAGNTADKSAEMKQHETNAAATTSGDTSFDTSDPSTTASSSNNTSIKGDVPASDPNEAAKEGVTPRSGIDGEAIYEPNDKEASGKSAANSATGNTSGSDSDDVDATASASQNAEGKYKSASDYMNDAVSAIEQGDQAATDIEGMEGQPPRVVFFMLDDTNPSSQERQALDQTVSENEVKVRDVQDAIKANPQVLSQLETRNVLIEDVVAARKNPDGSFSLFVR